MPTNNSCDYFPVQHDVLIGAANGQITSVAPSATSGVPVISQGAASDPVFGTAAIAGGGTNATSMSTSTGIVKYDGTSLVTSTTAKIDSSNRYTNTSQPCFIAAVSANVSNVTGDGTVYTVIFNTASTDQGSNFNTTTGTFTAPVTGKYQFNIEICIASLSALFTDFVATLVTTAASYQICRLNPGVVFSGASSEVNIGSAFCVPMSASDTATVTVQVSGSTKTITLEGNGGGFTFTQFSGFLVC